MEEDIHGEESTSPYSTPLLSADLSQLSEPEAWWRDHQLWLEERGYMLRPRYRPGWQPSWIANPHKPKYECEDMDPPISSYILDAVRISDNSLVVLKKVINWRNPHEVEISQYLSSEALRSDPRNHSVHILDVLDVPDDPDVTIMILPLLRACDNPRWQTEGEVLSFIKQIFEGIQYMHELHVAHRDCTVRNIMYDPRQMFPNMFHPRRPSRNLDYKLSLRHSTRTACPVRYYFIDFGLSRRYNPDDGSPREHPIRGGDKSVPEFKTWNGELLDPFPTDIYYLGNVIKRTVLEHYCGMEFLVPLVTDMVQPDPSKRPTIDDVVRRFDELLKRRPFWVLRSRLVPLNEDTVVGWYRNTRHVFQTIRYVLTRKSAVSVPA